MRKEAREGLLLASILRYVELNVLSLQLFVGFVNSLLYTSIILLELLDLVSQL